MSDNGWPGEPGVPLNPERDGWHWLRTPDEIDAPYEWRATGECERGRWPAYWVSVDADDWQPAECTYIAPAFTPAEEEARVKEAEAKIAAGCLISNAAEVADLVAKARRDALREAADLCDQLSEHTPGICAIAIREMADEVERDCP